MTDLTLTSGCVQAREQGAVLHLVLDRAAKLNAMTASMYQDLTRGVEHLAKRDDLHVLLLTGNGRAWCAGNDIGDFLNADPASRDSGKLSPAMVLVHALMALDKPVVIGVQGNATGIGTTLLLHADLVVAADDARFQTAFINLGLVPEAGSSLLLAEKSPTAMAMTKQLLRQSHEAIKTQIEKESVLFAERMFSEDTRARFAGFLKGN